MPGLNLKTAINRAKSQPTVGALARTQRITNTWAEKVVHHFGNLGINGNPFDPDRKAILLVGGDKRGDKQFYEKMLPLADSLFDKYLAKWRK